MLYELVKKVAEHHDKSSEAFYTHAKTSESIFLNCFKYNFEFLPIKSIEHWISKSLTTETRSNIIEYMNVLSGLVWIGCFTAYLYLMVTRLNSAEDIVNWLAIRSVIYNISIFLLVFVFLVYRALAQNDYSYMSVNFPIRFSLLTIFILICCLAFQTHKLAKRKRVMLKIKARTLNIQNFIYNAVLYGSILMFRINVLFFFIWVMLICWLKYVNDKEKEYLEGVLDNHRHFLTP